jgi:outer membrane protein assembly factor BamB
MISRIAALSLGAVAIVPHLGAADWPSFRGPGAAGVADGQGLPIKWDVATGTNVAWKTAIPGAGHSSPVVSGGRVFVTTSVGEQPASFVFGDEGGIAPASDTGRHAWRVLALGAKDGGVLWDREVFSAEPRAKRHVKGSYANSTPTVAGDTVVAILGSQGMVALDVADGTVRWRVDLGTLNPGLFGDATSEWGYASSPVTDGRRVYVQVDRHEGSYLAAFDLASGQRLWTVERDERPVWATPTLVEVGERRDLVVIGGYHTRGYDPETGTERWRFADEAEVKTPTPFVADGLIILSGGYRGRTMFALRRGAEGDVSLAGDETSGPFVAWTTEPGGPYTSTPVAYEGLLYSVRDEGIFQAHDLSNGSLVHRERTQTTHAASPVASDGRVYLAAEGGEVLVYRAGREPELLARNDMGEACMATPAIAGGALIVRTTGHVYSISEKGRAAE